jgi:prepilin-type N-terminal cleavage/methylation domain-containing protein
MPNVRRYRRKGRAAFTIIELVVVLVLIGIISAVVAPAIWNAAAPDSTNTLAAPLVSLLRSAQRTAAEQNEVVTVLINPGNNAYRAEVARDGGTPISGTLPFPTQAHFITDSARLRIVFNPTGSVSADPLVLADAKNVAVIRIDPWTGAMDVVRQQ